MGKLYSSALTFVVLAAFIVATLVVVTFALHASGLRACDPGSALPWLRC